MGTTNILDMNNRISALEKGGGGVDLNAYTEKVDIAPEFSDATNYNAGDLVYYDGLLYEFQLDHTAGSWEQSEVQQKDLSDILNNIPAERIRYDNTESGLLATDIQGAVDELNNKISTGTITTQHLTGLQTDGNGCIYLDLEVDSYILVGATTKDFSAAYGPFFTIGIWKESNIYKYMLRLTDLTGAAKASSNYWVDIHYMEREV